MPRPRATVRLLCVPFAGGAATVFREWPSLLPDHVDVCAVELAGRGIRFGEPPVGDVEAVAAEIVEAARPLMDRPVVLFGHSVGARIAFAMAQREPRFGMLIASGARSPELPPRRRRSELSDDALIAELVRLGGTPEAVLAEPELMALYLGVLRADFRINERRVPVFDAVVDIPITALAAHDDDESSVDEVRAWRLRTSGAFRLIELDGGHFFLNSRRDEVIAHLRAQLDEWLAMWERARSAKTPG